MKRIHLPPQALRHELPRTHLLERLATATDYRVIALVGPSGYGKTTVLAQFARSTPYAVVWLSLQEDDADPRTLTESLKEAVVRGFVTLEPGLFVPTQQGSSLKDLAAQLNYLPFSVRIILDGLQLLGADSGRELDRFIGALSEGHQVLVGSYLDPPLRLAHWVARDAALIIGLEELAFTRQESELYLHARHFEGWSDAAYAHLCGWPVGLALISSEASLHYQPEHLIADLIDTLDPGIADTLCEAAVMETWEEPLAQTLGLALPTGWLEQVKKLGLPMAPLGVNRYAPHGLLLETLLKKLRLRPERYRLLSARMAAFHLAGGDSLAALRHLHQAQQPEAALSLAQQLVAGHTERLEMRLVCRVLEDFDPEQLPPTLQLQWAGALLETGQPEGGMQMLERAGKVAKSATFHFYSARFAGSLGDFSAQLEQSSTALQHYPDDLPLYRVKAHSLLNLNRSLEALEVSDYALKLARGLSTVRIQQVSAQQVSAQQVNAQRVEEAQCLHLRAQCLYNLGRWQDYQITLEQTLSCFEALSMPLRTLYIHNDLADLYRKQGRLEEAQTLLERAIRVARDENSATLMVLLETLGETQLDAGNRESGLESLRQALALCSEFGALNLQNRIRLILAEALARLEMTAQAEAQLEAMDQVGEVLQPRVDFVRGLLALVRGQDELAQSLLGELHFEAHHPLALRAEVYRRELHLRLKQRSQITPLDTQWMREHPAKHVLRQDAPWVSRTLRELKIQFDSPTQSTQRILRLETLGLLRARVEDSVLHIPFAKAGELLVWLALYGPATRERIVDALWDGSAEERHIGYFKVAARRLRLSLSEAFPEVVNPLPFEQGVYTLSTEFRVELDVRWLPDPTLEPHEQLEQLLELWKGEFLPGFTSEWIEFQREHAAEKATLYLLSLAALTLHTHPALALQAFEQVLNWDSLNLTAHQSLIRLHHYRQDLAAAMQAYQRYAQIMINELGDIPQTYEILVA